MNKSIRTLHTTFKGSVLLPGSKSISNRALMIRAYAGFAKMPIEALSEADDTRMLQKNLKTIGSCAQTNIPTIINCGNAGTVFRFLATYLCTAPGKWLLTGTERMKARPVADLVDALKQLGASVGYAGKHGFPPLIIHGQSLTGGETSVSMEKSSQFASSLVLAAPIWKKGLKLHLEGNLSSMPYLEMSLRMMEHFGARVKREERTIFIAPEHYKKNDFMVEADWSSAAFWYELVALSKGGELMLKGLRMESLQGDSRMVSFFDQLGVASFQEPEGILIFKTGKLSAQPHFDLQDYPDMLPALAATCAGLGVEARFTGLENLQYKESDRTASLQKELTKLGVDFHKLDEGSYHLKRPFGKTFVAETHFETYNDHRMAMAFAPLSMVLEQVKITDPDVVEKSYPNYWDELGKLGIAELTDTEN